MTSTLWWIATKKPKYVRQEDSREQEYNLYLDSMSDYLTILLVVLASIHFGLWKKSINAGGFIFAILVIFLPLLADAHYKQPCEYDPNHKNKYHLCEPLPTKPTDAPELPIPPTPPTSPSPPEEYISAPTPPTKEESEGTSGYDDPAKWPGSSPDVYEFYERRVRTLDNQAPREEPTEPSVTIEDLQKQLREMAQDLVNLYGMLIQLEEC